MAERPDSTPDLATIDVPTLVVTSNLDTLIPAEATSPMADQIPGAELAMIDGAGHLSNLEAAGAFGELLGAPRGAVPAGLRARPQDPPVD